MSEEINLALGIQTRNFPVSFLRGLHRPEGSTPVCAQAHNLHGLVRARETDYNRQVYQAAPQ